MMLNEDIFREYDIRGIVTNDFQDEVVINLGKAFGSYIKRNDGKIISVSGDITAEKKLEILQNANFFTNNLNK